ncbi:MAG: large conductance mechanosensitive channel protein MscL [Akkermansia sp.]|nr:large conductance mechanosensitive channel protein MscL [Akkermansia sp.]
MIKKLKPAWVDEFKAFALKGNVIDMAIGVIIGGAFGKIVTSLVNDIIMPSFAMIFGSGKSLSEMAFRISDAKDAPVIKYGLFCQTVLDFLLIALSIFFIIRIACKLRARFKKQEAEAAAPAPAPEPPPTPEDILLLREIRDALKNK